MTNAPSLSTIVGLPGASSPQVAVGLSLVLPMYNERDNIDRTLSAAVGALQEAVTEFEIIIVDDGSTDGSAEVAAAWQTRLPQIRLIRHPTNRGYGAALRSGFAAASKMLVMYTDIDLPCDLRVIHQILPLFDRADMVIGYRQPYGESWFRWFRSRTYNGLLHMLFGLDVKDANFSFKIFRTDLLQRCTLYSHSCLIDAELLINAGHLGYRLVEVPVRYQPRISGASKLTSPLLDMGVLRELVRQYWRFRNSDGRK